MKATKKFLVGSLLAVLACGVLEAAPKMYGFKKPYVIVADEPDAYFKDPANPATAAGLEQYADAFAAGGKVTHVFWSLSSAAREKFAAAGVEPYKTLVARTQAKGAEAWVSIRVSDILGAKPEIWKPSARNDLVKAAVALAKECPTANGYELDFLSGITGFSAEAPDGEKPFNRYDAARFYQSLRMRIGDAIRNREVAVAVRVPADNAAVGAMGLRHGEGGAAGATLILPCVTSEQAKAGTFCGSDWHELDRVGPRVIPGVPIEALSAEELAGWTSAMRGWGFPGVVFLHGGAAPKGLREAICVQGLADWDKTAAGVRKILVGACGGAYEFALQRGSVVKGQVRVTVRGAAATAGEALLNGRRPQSSAKSGDAVTYVFAPEAAIDRRNFLRLSAPAEGPVEVVLAAE